VPTSQWIRPVQMAHKVTAGSILVFSTALAAFMSRAPSVEPGAYWHTRVGLLTAIAALVLGSYVIGAAFAWLRYALSSGNAVHRSGTVARRSAG
jgi:hypothetical protein